MSTTTVAPVEQAKTPPKRPNIPTLAPYIAPNVICKNRDCLRVLTPRVSNEKGGEPLLQYDCRNCQYTFFASLIHAQGEYRALGAEKAKLPEVFQKSE